MPRASFTRLSSLHNLINYRAEKAIWEKESSFMRESRPESTLAVSSHDTEVPIGVEQDNLSITPTCAATPAAASSNEPGSPLRKWPSTLRVQHNKFRHFAAEVGFCFTICMTQLLSEYLISGFAIELPRLVSKHDIGAGRTGLFWPASLLMLILSAALLFSARVSDKFGGYLPFMCGVAWLAIWTAVPGQIDSPPLLNLSRAMQGLAIAALTPATFAMIGSVYPEGRRKRLVLGVYSACAPTGFFVGLLAGSAIERPQWYFWIASILSSLTFLTGFLTVPSDGTNRRELRLEMDWIGALLIAAGLVAMSYGLSVAPYAGRDRHDWSSPMLIAPLSAGGVLLIVACWYEARVSHCPLLPLDFFKPRSVGPLSLACMFFYASYGVWLYESAEYFEHPATTRWAMNGTTLALWYAPTAVGGLVLCTASGWVTSVVPMMALVMASGVAWIAAPLLLALAPLPLSYWPWVFPSMLCATLGIDLTYTVSIIFVSESQPLRYQGLAGAVCSILVNLAISFALSISEIVSLAAKEASHRAEGSARLAVAGYRAAFYYGAASAAVGFVICVLFVRIPGSKARRDDAGEEGHRPSPSHDSLMARIVATCGKRHGAVDAV